MSRMWSWASIGVLAAGLLLVGVPVVAPAQIGIPVVEPDAFPVFDHPAMLPAARAEAAGIVLDSDMVIGVARGREAKAYPITIMGVHELGNDTIDGLPIAVTW